jgi:hypothetical protein
MPNGGPPGAIPGGICYGGAIEPNETDWHQDPAGHWFCYRDAVPALLIRMDINPRLLTWKEIGGAHPSHIWRVPVLIEPVHDEHGDIILMKSAIDPIWSGPGWDVPANLESLRRRLMMMCHALGTNKATLGSPDAVAVALDVLREGHEFAPAEIIKAGWVSEVLVVRTLVAACGMELSP